MNQVKQEIFISLGIISLIFIVLGLRNNVVITEYHISDKKLNDKMKVALIADTHSCDYGKDHKEITDKLEKIKPDLVFLSGDIVDDQLPMKKGFILVEKISKKYPTFYVTGNHEMWSGKHDYIKEKISSFGVKVLSGDSEIVKVNGTSINIMGIDDPDIGESIYSKEYEKLEKVYKNGLTFLLAHRPERTFDYSELGVDYIFSGHAHGGQWRVPILLDKGLYAPNQGLFPKFTKGITQLDRGKLIVSRGLSRESTRIPRFYNPPEIVVINFDKVE
ncbi:MULTISPECIES: metallophosphoesterase [unclassified Streptococcus]|uniref:metallophosphoesterase n=1 Tax=unclassified Streptococcus TaxID=2608887 RepID=UPI00066FDED1|nr:MULTISPECIES: metallophosphoesterase [unclassified Streptococcus]